MTVWCHVIDVLCWVISTEVIQTVKETSFPFATNSAGRFQSIEITVNCIFYFHFTANKDIFCVCFKISFMGFSEHLLCSYSCFCSGRLQKGLSPCSLLENSNNRYPDRFICNLRGVLLHKNYCQHQSQIWSRLKSIVFKAVSRTVNKSNTSLFSRRLLKHGFSHNHT